jgi:twitching motility protein PilT
MEQPMDYTKRIFDYFVADETRAKLVIAPHAPPIEFSNGVVNVALDVVLDETDTADTLVGMLNYGGDKSLTGRQVRNPEQLSETFYLSIRGAGRFRITYLTQRSSKAIVLVRVPSTIPSCTELNVEQSMTDRLLSVLRDPQGGVVAVFGPSAESNSALVYAMLQEVNGSDRRVILVQERELSYLMRHNNSIVIQRELHSDCPFMDGGIHEGLALNPDILYVGDLLVTDRLPALVRAVEMGMRVVISVVASERDSLLHEFNMIFGEQNSRLLRRIREVVHVTPLPAGKLSAAFESLPTKTSVLG